MVEEKKQNKVRKTFTLSPINDAWLKRRALELSTPEDKVSDSALLDRILDDARLAESPTQKIQKKSLVRLETVIA
jgi:nitroreductase